jgi:DNA-binding GntR family transcriptional regulator
MKKAKTNGTKSSLSESVYIQLKRDIMSLKLLSGSVLTENGLAESLGISRTPIREALRRLQKDGLVDMDHGRGARVSQVSFRDAIEMYEIRGLVEPYAACLAASQLTPELTQRLRKMLEVIAEPSLTSDISLRWQIDRELHDLILEAAGNELLRALVWDLRIRTERAFAYVAQRGMEFTRQEHVRLVEAILRGDADAAEQLMREHLANAKARLIQR